MMSEDQLGANLGTLARLGTDGLEAWLSDVSADGEPERSGRQVTGVLLRTANGLVRMHSRRDPVGDAERVIPEKALGAPLVVVIGAGAGFVIDALERRAFSGRVLVLEPSAASLLATLSRRSWATWLDGGRLRFVRGPDYPGWHGLWEWIGASADAPPVVIHPVLARERPATVRHAADVLKRVLYNANANEAARRAFAGPYLLNTLFNLRHLVESRDVGELFGRFRDVPAFVLAAGPSLDRNLEELRPHRDGALVITVDTALRPCLAAGIEPDLVVGVDPGEANLRHLAIGAAPLRTHLVAEPSLAPGSFDAFAGRVFTFRVDRHHPWPWLQEQGLDRAQLLAWGSVFTTTIDLAVKLGCNPVALFGADFAYTDGQPYCRGTAFEDDWARNVAAGEPIQDVWRRWRRQPVVVERGVDGRDVETSLHLQAFRDWVTEYCGRQFQVTVVNGTGAGILRSLPPWRPDARASSSPAPRVRPAGPRSPRRLRGPSCGWVFGADAPEPWTCWDRLPDPVLLLADLLPQMENADRESLARGYARWRMARIANCHSLLADEPRSFVDTLRPQELPADEPLASPSQSVAHWRARHADGYFEQHRWYEDRLNALGVETILRLLRPRTDEVLLEIGCGYGRLLWHLAPYVRKAIGIDLAPQPLETARHLLATRGDIELLLGDGLTLRPVASGTVDAVVAFTVLQHVPRISAAEYLSETRRVLRPGGRACLQFFDHGAGSDWSGDPSVDSLSYSAAEVCDLAAGVGLIVRALEREPLQDSYPGTRFSWLWVVCDRNAT